MSSLHITLLHSSRQKHLVQCPIYISPNYTRYGTFCDLKRWRWQKMGFVDLSMVILWWCYGDTMCLKLRDAAVLTGTWKQMKCQGRSTEMQKEAQRYFWMEAGSLWRCSSKYKCLKMGGCVHVALRRWDRGRLQADCCIYRQLLLADEGVVCLEYHTSII